MDSDDISSPERFAQQVLHMDTHPQCGVVGAAIRMFGDKPGVWGLPPLVKLHDLLIHGALIAHPTAMLRTSVLRNNKIYYDSNYPHAEDYAFWMSIAQVSEIHNLQTILLNYRWHAQNASVVHREEQVKSTERARSDFLKKLSNENTVFNA